MKQGKKDDIRNEKYKCCIPYLNSPPRIKF